MKDNDALKKFYIKDNIYSNENYKDNIHFLSEVLASIKKMKKTGNNFWKKIKVHDQQGNEDDIDNVIKDYKSIIMQDFIDPDEEKVVAIPKNVTKPDCQMKLYLSEQSWNHWCSENSNKNNNGMVKHPLINDNHLYFFKMQANLHAKSAYRKKIHNLVNEIKRQCLNSDSTEVEKFIIKSFTKSFIERASSVFEEFSLIKKHITNVCKNLDEEYIMNEIDEFDAEDDDAYDDSNFIDKLKAYIEIEANRKEKCDNNNEPFKIVFQILKDVYLKNPANKKLLKQLKDMTIEETFLGRCVDAFKDFPPLFQTAIEETISSFDGLTTFLNDEFDGGQWIDSNIIDTLEESYDIKINNDDAGELIFNALKAIYKTNNISNSVKKLKGITIKPKNTVPKDQIQNAIYDYQTSSNCFCFFARPGPELNALQEMLNENANVSYFSKSQIKKAISNAKDDNVNNFFGRPKSHRADLIEHPNLYPTDKTGVSKVIRAIAKKI